MSLSSPVEKVGLQWGFADKTRMTDSPESSDKAPVPQHNFSLTLSSGVFASAVSPAHGTSNLEVKYAPHVIE